MKRYKTTIIALVALVIVSVAVAVVLIVTKGNNSSADPTEAPSEEYVKLISFEYDYIAGLESKVNGTVITLERSIVEVDGKNTKVWTCTSDPSIEANTGTVNSLVSTVVSSSSGIAIKDVESLTDYGFNEDGTSDLYIKATNIEGQTITLYVGGYEFSRNYRFVYLDDGSKTVYKVNAISVGRLLFQKESVIQMKAFAYLTTSVPKLFVINEKGSKLLELECTGIQEGDDSWKWRVKYPLERKSQDTKVNELTDSLKDLPLDSIAVADVTEEEFVNYGLAPADIEYYYYAETEDGALERYFIKVGNKTEDGDKYYCLVDDGKDGIYEIYTVSTSYVYKTINVMDYIDAYLYMEDSDNISKIEIDIAGEKHTMTYTYETVTKTDKDGNETEEPVVTRYWDGREAVDDDDITLVTSGNRYTPLTEEDIALNRDDDLSNDIQTVNPYEAFNWVLLSLYTNTVIKDVVLEEPAQEDIGEIVASITYTENSGKVYKVELFKRDNTTAWAYVNGEYAGGYTRTTGLFGDDYLSADYAAAVKCMKIIIAMIP